MRFRPFRTLIILSLIPGVLQAQLVSQSELTPDDADPDFQLTLEHLALSTRWMGVPPRNVIWSPDGDRVYFRWRQDPEPDQLPDTDPWFEVSRDGRNVRQLRDAEVHRIPASNIRWARNRSLAAWSRDGTLYLWDGQQGTRAVYTGSSVTNLSVSRDGTRVFFATRGAGFQSQQHGDLWVYEVISGHVRELARGTDRDDRDDKRTDAGKWIHEEELDLIEIVRKRKEDRETRDLLTRRRDPFRLQEVPVKKGTRAYNLQLSPHGRHVTFMWTKDPRRQHRTQYMEFVNEDGYATQQDARPKVGEPLPEYKMGIVRYDPTVPHREIEVRWVEDGVEKDTIIHGPYWNPQGTRALVQILSMDHKDRWISLLDLESGQTTVIDHQQEDAWIGGPLVGGRWAPGYLEWLPDGEHFGFGSTASGWAMLWLGNVNGEVRALTDGEWEVRRAGLSADGRTWYLVTSKEHPGEEHLYHLPAPGGELVRVTQGEGKHGVWVSPDGRRLATVFQSENRLPDLYLQDNAPGVAWKRITRSGRDDFYRFRWIPSEIISFPDPRGNETWAKIWQRPRNPNGAAVVYAHGCGECAQGVDKGWTRIGAWLYANYLHQFGYQTASVDYRGSSGYGHRNRTYAYRQMGISDIDSALPLLEILARRYGVDRRRIGVWGGSYGGFFTIMSLLRHPGKYAAGVALYPVTDWAHYNQGYTSRILNGTPQSDPEAYRISSPVYYADGLADALQIQHGMVDGNVQVQDSFRLAQIFLEKKKNFDLVLYPMEDHGWDEVPTRRDSFRRMTDWFNRHLLRQIPHSTTGGN